MLKPYVDYGFFIFVPVKRFVSFLANTLIVLISTAAVLVLCELVFQKILFSDWEKAEFLREPGAYATIYEDDHEAIFTDEYWLLYYLFDKQFKPPNNPHPIFGWVGKFDRLSLIHNDKDKVKGRIPVLLFGDSFSYCVGAKCFEEILNEDSAFASKYYLLNYGVGGYGIDQIYILANEVIPLYNRPVVLFGMLTRDMDRSILKFRTGQKPYFELDDNKLNLKGVPMEPKASYYVENHMPDITSYLYRYMRNSLNNYIPKNDPRTIKVLANMIALNEQIIIKAHDMLKSSGVDYRFLVFSPVYNSDTEWREKVIRDLLEKEGAPSIFTKDIYQADSNYANVPTSFYESPEHGHPTDYQNELICDEIWSCLMDSAYASVVDSLNSAHYASIRNEYDNDHVDHYIFQIKKDKVWLKSIKEKASQRQISVDSMLQLDAIWLKDIDEKAREQGISRDSMIRLEADWILKQSLNN